MFNRDYLHLPWGEDTLVVTCDSIGAIGAMELDVVNATGFTVGSFLARVALMELFATGAELVSMSCTFSIEPEYASSLLEAILHEASLVHPNPSDIIVISTEKNVPTRQTGAGITCIGRIAGYRPRTGLSRNGDLVVALGTPKMGAEVNLNDPTNADLPTLLTILTMSGIGDIAPAGSRGMLYEAEAVAKSSGLLLDLFQGDHSLLTKSAGPGTSLVFSCRPIAIDSLVQFPQPLQIIGTLKEEHQ